MTQETGTVTMYPKLIRREWIFGTAPDPKDARIAELEAQVEAANGAGALVIEVARQRDAECKRRIKELASALKLVRILAEVNNGRTDWQRLQAAGRIARAALVPPPENDMTMTIEAMDA